MKKKSIPLFWTVLLYGSIGGILIAALKLIEYRFIIREHSVEIYGAIVAALFSALGIWLGIRFTRKRVIIKEVLIDKGAPFVLNTKKIEELGVTSRELEVLGLIAEGFSNKEIGERLFVSENTVKTHGSRLFEKLNVKRRTQAVQTGKELGLIP